MTREQLFGTDLALTDAAPGLDLGVARGGDLALAAGIANIEQALRLRLQVRRGELAPLGIPDYGSRLHELIGEPNNQRTRVIALSFARTAIEEDPRVVKVLDASATSTGSDLRLVLELQLIATATPLNLVYDLALGTR